MAHRDDHDAALARAAALSRDLRRAQAEAAAAEARAAAAESRAAAAEARASRATSANRATTTAAPAPTVAVLASPAAARRRPSVPAAPAVPHDTTVLERAGMIAAVLSPIWVAAVVYLLTR
jgi:hypothetical protein